MSCEEVCIDGCDWFKYVYWIGFDLNYDRSGTAVAVPMQFSSRMGISTNCIPLKMSISCDWKVTFHGRVL